MSPADVQAVIRSDVLAPVAKERAGIQRGHALSLIYNFELQLKRARDAPSGSRHHFTWKETELALGLLYFEEEVYHWDIEKRGSGAKTAGNSKRIYDTSIHKRADWSDPFEKATPFTEDAPSYHNPPPMKKGAYPKQVIDGVKGALGGIEKKDAYCFVWFGTEAVCAREWGLGQCVLDAGYLIRSLLGVTLDGQSFRGAMPVAGEDDVDADDDDDGDDEDDVGASGSSSVEKLRTPADLLGPLLCDIEQLHRASPDAGWTQPAFLKVLFAAALEAYMRLMGKPPPRPPRCRSPKRPWWAPWGKR